MAVIIFLEINLTFLTDLFTSCFNLLYYRLKTIYDMIQISIISIYQYDSFNLTLLTFKDSFPFFAPWHIKIKTASPKNSGLIMFLSY